MLVVPCCAIARVCMQNSPFFPFSCSLSHSVASLFATSLSTCHALTRTSSCHPWTLHRFFLFPRIHFCVSAFGSRCAPGPHFLCRLLRRAGEGRLRSSLIVVITLFVPLHASRHNARSQKRPCLPSSSPVVLVFSGQMMMRTVLLLLASVANIVSLCAAALVPGVRLAFAWFPVASERTGCRQNLGFCFVSCDSLIMAPRKASSLPPNQEAA